MLWNFNVRPSCELVCSVRIICVLSIFSSFTYVVLFGQKNSETRLGNSSFKRIHDATWYYPFLHKMIKWQWGSIFYKIEDDIALTVAVRITMSSLSCADSLSVADSLLGDEVLGSEVPASSAPDSLPTFQMFREKKARVEAELRYHYRFRYCSKWEIITVNLFQSDIWKWKTVLTMD